MSQQSTKVVQLLVVSQEDAVTAAVCSIGRRHTWHVESATSAWAAIERLESGMSPDLVLLNAPSGDSDGLHFLRWLRRLRPQLPIVLVCDAEDASKKQEAIRLGARDVLVGPMDEQAMKAMISRNLSHAEMNEADITSDDVERLEGEGFFVGASIVMRKLRAQARLLATTDVPVLIVGETGSGKRSTAQLIHELSVRSGSAFAAVNCAVLPSDLLEIELFGAGRNGSGAVSIKPGKLEFCEHGTILLQEISEMPLSLQAKLLRVLQYKQFDKPGTGTPVQIDVRILASSTTNVEPAIAEKKLREDLYYRLSAYTIHVPPLRERREEVPLLLHYFMRQLSKHYSLPARAFPQAVLEACQAHSWPGNLRELETFVKRYLMVGGQDRLFDSQVHFAGAAGINASEESAEPGPRSSMNQWSNGAPVPESLRSLVQSLKLEAERNAIIEALKTTRWNRKAAARLLRVSYRTLLYKIEQYQLRSSDSGALAAGAVARNNTNGIKGNG